MTQVTEAKAGAQQQSKTDPSQETPALPGRGAALDRSAVLLEQAAPAKPAFDALPAPNKPPAEKTEETRREDPGPIGKESYVNKVGCRLPNPRQQGDKDYNMARMLWRGEGPTAEEYRRQTGESFLGLEQLQQQRDRLNIEIRRICILQGKNGALKNVSEFPPEVQPKLQELLEARQAMHKTMTTMQDRLQKTGALLRPAPDLNDSAPARIIKFTPKEEPKK